MRHLFTGLLVSCTLACGADRAAFRPSDNVTATGQQGQPAAAYQIKAAADANAHAEVRVWSRGAREGEQATTIALSVEVRNLGSQPVTLDQNSLELTAIANNGVAMVPPRLVALTEDTPGMGLTVAPASAATYELTFAMPQGVDPDHVGNLRLRWALLHDGGERYMQFTDFRRYVEPSTTQVAGSWGMWSPVYGYYDPFLYGPPYGYHSRVRVPVGRATVRDHRRTPRR